MGQVLQYFSDESYPIRLGSTSTVLGRGILMPLKTEDNKYVDIPLYFLFCDEALGGEYPPRIVRFMNPKSGYYAISDAYDTDISLGIKKYLATPIIRVEAEYIAIDPITNNANIANNVMVFIEPRFFYSPKQGYLKSDINLYMEDNNLDIRIKDTFSFGDKGSYMVNGQGFDEFLAYYSLEVL